MSKFASRPKRKAQAKRAKRKAAKQLKPTSTEK